MISLLLAAVLAAPPEAGVHAAERDAYGAVLSEYARAAFDNFGGAACPASIARPISTAPASIADHPEMVVWRERVQVDGCGRRAVENINVGRFEGTPPWRMASGLPGESLAGLSLQQSALPAAIGQAKAGLPAGCQGVRMGDAYVAARPGQVDLAAPGGPAPASAPGRIGATLPEGAGMTPDKVETGQAWAEVWPLEVCGQDRTTMVVFAPLRGQASSLYLFMPVWKQIAAEGAGARPAPAPAPK